ncbi:MAG TPA: UDP-N-acetylglucosamine 4,6-dehydratase (inverting) [Burkholderiales bacterium]|nr:UDP-N-acetylglucosamine 4,6-dehydratase (inverting) [Burkholderiales bacterium]
MFSSGSQHRTFEQDLRDLNGKSVLVTGGTGSFGSAFVKTVIERFAPAKLIVFSRDELKQFEMGQQFSDREHRFLRYFIGDVRDCERLEIAMRGVDYVVHAAALKQVPVAEYNPFECIRTNVHGAENVVRAAIRSGVQRVIALSTDKAANPINLYGASKLASDKIFVAANALAGRNGTRFAVVRYGNVVGSRGSIVPLFHRLIRNGATRLPITDPRMTRFVITLEQGVNVVLSSLQMMEGGEIFVPKIPSVNIVDLAQAMLPGSESEIVGIRPGEKLHEVMISQDDSRSTLELEDRYIIEPLFDFWSRSRYETHRARRVDEGFQYTSKDNIEWLGVEDIRDLLARV